MLSEVIYSILHRVAIVQVVVKFFEEQPASEPKDIPVGRLVKMGTVEPRDANAAAVNFRD